MLGLKVASKAVVKKAIKEGNPIVASRYIQETSLFSQAEFNGDGKYTIVGPDAYTNRKFYGEITVKEGKIIKIT